MCSYIVNMNMDDVTCVVGFSIQTAVYMLSVIVPTLTRCRQLNDIPWYVVNAMGIVVILVIFGGPRMTIRKILRNSICTYHRHQCLWYLHNCRLNYPALNNSHHADMNLNWTCMRWNRQTYTMPNALCHAPTQHHKNIITMQWSLLPRNHYCSVTW